MVASSSTDGGWKPSTARNTISSFSTSTMIVSPDRYSLNSSFSDSGSSIMRWMARRSGTCGNVAWAPTRQELAVDICSGGEPTTVAIVDVASAGVRQLTPPDGVTWSVPAFKPDGTLTLVEQRGDDAVVVTLTPDRSKVAASGLRRSSTTITTIDWSANGDLLVCDADGIVVAAIGGSQAQQVATGYTAGAW